MKVGKATFVQASFIFPGICGIGYWDQVFLRLFSTASLSEWISITGHRCKLTFTISLTLKAFIADVCHLGQTHFFLQQN